MPDPRPTPRTTTDELLLLVLDELQGMRADLAGARGAGAEQPMSGRVEIREPAPAPAPVKKAAPAKKATASPRRRST